MIHVPETEDPQPEPPLQDWKDRIPDWDLAASEEHTEETESVLLINGKASGFQDVKEGPAVYIGRENDHYGLDRSPLANPYPVAEYSRKDSLLQYADLLIDAVEESKEMRAAVRSCYGKPLACWCIPKLCHGHVISLYLVYTLHAGMDPAEAGDHIKRRLQNSIDTMISHGEANPAEYY